MEEINRQVKRARRRMVLQQFLTIVAWSLFATLLVGALGLAIPKIWPLVGIDRAAWMWSWIGGSIAAGLLVAGVWTYVVRRSSLEAAIEIDRRFGLKERVSSTLALAPEEINSDIGRALMQDAVRRVERIDVREHFKIVPSWRNVLPILPAIALVLLPLLPDAATKKAEASANAKENERKQVKKAITKVAQLLKRSESQKTDPTKLEKGDFEKMFDKELDKLINKEGLDKKNALIELNKLSNEVDKRKQQLGGAEKLKEELKKLAKIEKGPGEKLGQALKEGDFQAAQKEMQKLAEKLKNGELTKEDEKALAKQAENIKERIQAKKEQLEEARKDLQKQIEQKMKEGDVAEAEKLQQKLDQMNQQKEQLEQKMDQLANNLDQLCQACQQGGKEGQQKAGQQMDKLAQNLKDLQKDLQEMENLDEMLDQLADAKEAMKCENCNGEGCKHCQGGGDKEGDSEGDGKGDKEGNKPGKGKTGKGRGEGARDEEETDKGFFDSQVRGDPKKGESIRIGDAEGKNAKGTVSIEVIKEQIRSEAGRDADASDETALSRDLKKHAKEYMEKFRKGELPE